MKNRMILLVSICALSLTACAGNAQIVAYNNLPQQAQTFVTTHFSQSDIAFILSERDGLHNEYEVRFNDGTKLEFDYQGNLEKIDCQTRPVPAGIVPAPIVEYVNTKHTGMFIVEYSIDRRKQSVELNTEVEIEFDRAGNFLRYDW